MTAPQYTAEEFERAVEELNSASGLRREKFTGNSENVDLITFALRIAARVARRGFIEDAIRDMPAAPDFAPSEYLRVRLLEDTP